MTRLVKRAQQSFDRKNIFVEKMGKKVNCYDAIQEAREDTEIYSVLERYGCIDKIIVDKPTLYNDVREIQALGNLREIKNMEIKAQNAFYALPIEERKKFNNDYKDFIKNGDKILAQEAAEAKEAAEAAKAAEAAGKASAAATAEREAKLNKLLEGVTL